MPKLVELQKPYRPLLPPCAMPYLGMVLHTGGLVGNRARVLEVGSGASTLWLAMEGCDITSIEHHAGWAGHIKEMAGRDNLSIDLQVLEKERFADRIAAYEDGLFDLIFVDCYSRVRNACVREAVSKIKRGRWLLLDDTQWQILGPSVKLLSDWHRQDFYGMVLRQGNMITKHDIAGLSPRDKIEITRCTFWQKP